MKIKIILLIFFAGIFLLFLHPIESGDFFHHLNTGRFIFQHHSLPYLDTFSFTAYGKPWIAHSWGAGLLLFGIYSLAGSIGISCFIAFLGTLTTFIVYSILRTLKLGIATSLLFCFVAASFASFRWPSRPEVFGPFFLMLLILLLLKIKKTLFFLPFFFLLWACIYGPSVIFGIVLFLLYIISQRLFSRKILTVFFLCLIAGFLNGYGWQSFLYILQIPPMAAHVGEWVSILKTINPSIPELLLFYQYIVLSYGLLLVLSFICIGFTLYKSPRFIAHQLFFFCLFFALLAPFVSTRFTTLGIFLAVPCIALSISSLKKNVSIILSICFLGVALLIVFLRFWLFPFGVGTTSTPFEPTLITFLQTHHIIGNAYESEEIGGYISWEVPDIKVFVDTRDDLYQPLGIFDELNKVSQGQLTLLQLLDNYHADIVIAETSDTQYRPLLYTPTWNMVYISDGYFVAVRHPLLKKFHLTPLTAIDPYTEPPVRFGQVDLAEKELKTLLQANKSEENIYRLSEILLAQGKVDEAQQFAQKLSLPTIHSSRTALQEMGIFQLLGKVFLAKKSCQQSYDALSKTENLSYHEFIFYPHLRLPTQIDLYLGDYYAACTPSISLAKHYYQLFLSQTANPLDIHKVEEKLRLLNNK